MLGSEDDSQETALLYHVDSRDLSSGPQAWQRVPLPVELSHWLSYQNF